MRKNIVKDITIGGVITGVLGNIVYAILLLCFSRINIKDVPLFFQEHITSGILLLIGAVAIQFLGIFVVFDLMNRAIIQATERPKISSGLPYNISRGVPSSTKPEKGWPMILRECISKLIEFSLESDSLRRKYKEQVGSVPEFQELTRQFVSVRIKLSMHLDFNHPDEKEFYNTEIQDLWESFNFGIEWKQKYYSLDELIRKIQIDTQSIIIRRNTV